MSYRCRLFLCVLAAGLAFYATSPSRAMEAPDSQTPVVLELFTSQSCSSCPPADALLGQWARGKNIIALGCHVTYWDQLSWKDTLSHEFCTQRQQAYSNEGGRHQVFTPELIVNGRDSMVGSREAAARAAIAKAAGQVKPITITAQKDGSFVALLPSIPDTNAAITLATFSAPVTQPIGRGENGGATVTYTHPVQSIETVKRDWNGTAQTLILRPMAIMTKGGGFAVLAQSGSSGTGAMVAAGQYVLAP